jgi:chemotaxis protein MotB
MPPQAAQTIAKMVPILAPFQQTKINVIGYTDNVLVGPELQKQGITNNGQLSLRRAQAVADFLISQGVHPILVSARGRPMPIRWHRTTRRRGACRTAELS